MDTDRDSAIEPDSALEASPVPKVSSCYVRFGPFQVDQNRQRVTRDGHLVKVRAKVYQVLIALIEKQGEVVSQEELKLRLWPPQTAPVNYASNVITIVNKLRKILGDSPDRPLCIKTVPRKGYCLLVPTEIVDCPVFADGMPPTDDANSNESEKAKDRAAPHSGLWITVALIASILAGVLLGAGIARLRIIHFACVSVAPALVHLSARGCLTPTLYRHLLRNTHRAPSPRWLLDIRVVGSGRASAVLPFAVCGMKNEITKAVYQSEKLAQEIVRPIARSKISASTEAFSGGL